MNLNQFKPRDMALLASLRKDSRMKLTTMSRQTRIPVSTIFDRIRTFKGSGLVRRYTSLVDFGRLGHQGHAWILLACNKNDRHQLQETLERHPNVNSLLRINNGWNLMAEVVSPGIREVEDFVEQIEDKARITKKMVLFIIREIRKEEFLASPEKELLLMNGKNETRATQDTG